MAPSRRARAQAADPLKVATAVVNSVQTGLQEHALRIRRYDNAYEVYRGTYQPVNADRKSWQSRLRVKYGMLIVNENIVSVINGIPHAKCTPRKQGDVLAAKAMEAVLDYYGQMDHLAEKQFDVAAQALIYGLSPAKNHWLYKEANRTQLVPGTDEVGNVLWTPGTTRIVEDDRPCMEPWDVYDCWWDPTARDVDSAAYVVLRSWLSKEELEKGRYNEDTGQGAYRNLDELYRAGQGQQPPSTAQNRILGTDEANRYKGKFEIWEVWRNDSLTVIGNRQVVLRDGPKPYWMKGKPIVIASARPDPFKIEGISETELVDHLQQARWTLENLRMDQLKMTVLRGATVRETVPDMAQLVFKPSFLWPVTDHDDVKFQDAAPLPPEAYEEDSSLNAKMEQITGINGYVTGQVDATGARSATGVSMLSKAANQPLAFKAEQLRLGIWQRTFEQWADLTKQFVTKDQEFKIDGLPDGQQWVTMGPQDIYGDYDVSIQAGEESADKQNRQAQLTALLGAVAPLIQKGHLNPDPIIEQLGEVFDFPNPAGLLAPQQQQPSAAPQLPAGPTPNILGNGNLPGGQQIVPHPMQSILRGNQ